MIEITTAGIRTPEENIIVSAANCPLPCGGGCETGEIS